MLLQKKLIFSAVTVLFCFSRLESKTEEPLHLTQQSSDVKEIHTGLSNIYFPRENELVRLKSARVSRIETIFNGELEPTDIDTLSKESFQSDLNSFMRESYDGNVLEQIIYLKSEGIIAYSPTNKEVTINDFEKLKKYFKELYDHNHE